MIRTIFVYKVTVPILGSQRLTCFSKTLFVEIDFGIAIRSFGSQVLVSIDGLSLTSYEC